MLLQVPDLWNNSIATELNSAVSGSPILAQLGVVSSYAHWLNPLRMLGMAFLFTSITLALTVIIGTLRGQADLLVGFCERASTASGNGILSLPPQQHLLVKAA